jgi:SAM-dependent methyltransferase
MRDAEVSWETIDCPICGGREFQALFEKAGEHFVRCAGCALTLINPRRRSDVLRARYDAAYSAGYTRKADKKLRRSRHRVRRLTREYRLHGRWLDVGCSAGFIVKAAEEAGFEAFGVDVEEGGIAYGREQLGLHGLACGLLEDQRYPAASFDAISAYDVIEHVPDLNRFVAELKRILAPCGVLDLGTPDIGHWRVPRRLETWAEFKPSEHLYYFNYGTLSRLLGQHGMKIDRKRFALKPGLKICAIHA